MPVASQTNFSRDKQRGYASSLILSGHGSMGSSQSKDIRTPAPPKPRSIRGVYHYTPIQNENEFRILTLFAGRANDKILIEIEHCDFRSRRDYVALSYCWGDASRPGRTIYIRQKHAWSTLEVTTNLYDALDQLRQENHFHLWVDAICINKDDLDEKSHQLKLMPHLYPQAAKVLAWLGRDFPGAKPAFEAISSWADVSTAVVQPDRRDVHEMRGKLLDDIRNGRSDVQEALGQLFGRDWFTRMWIIQEVCVRPDNPPIIMCGRHQIPFVRMIRGFWALATNLNPAEVLQVFGENVQNILPLMQLFGAEPHSYRFSQVLRAVHARNASLPHDKIYGVLGLVTRHGHRYPDPDYNLQPFEMSIRYTRAIIEEEKSLIILHDISTTSSDPRIPSWAIKYDRLSAGAVFTATNRGAHNFRATLDHTPQVRASHSLDSSLCLKGVRVDQVHKLLNTADISARIRSCDSWATMLSFIDRLVQGLRLGETYKFTNEPMAKSVLRTLIVDDFVIGTPMSKDTTDDFIFQRWAATYLSRVLEQSSSYENVREILNEMYDLGEVSTPHEDDSERRKWRPLLGNALLPAFIQASTEGSGRTLFVSEQGRICSSGQIRTGDEVWLLYGSTYPIILRPQQDGAYTLVAPSYIHGMMYGEAFDAASGSAEYVTLI